MAVSFHDFTWLAVRVLEGAGIVVMLAGAVSAAVIGARLYRTDRPEAGTAFRQHLGRAILLGLEFLIAADIIRTVGEVPTMENVLVLGAIVLIRTFLSFTLQVELEGHWPWERSRTRVKKRRRLPAVPEQHPPH